MDTSMALTTVTTPPNMVNRESEYQPDTPQAMTQHDVLQINLHGPTLVLTILTVIIAIQILQPALTCTLLVVAPLPLIIHNDYTNFLNLGPGGTPSTFLGYLKIAYLRLFAISDPYSPDSVISDTIYPTIGYYEQIQAWLPYRTGPRPRIVGIAPQRQLNQSGCAKMNRLLRGSLEMLAAKHPNVFRVGTSCFEKKGIALFSRHPVNPTCRGEICHIHHSDRSMHLSLHPDDAKVVLKNGWGERHPLARGGWMKAYVPREFIMIYAPRNRTELVVTCRIIEAAGFWVCGKPFVLKAEDQSLMEQGAEAEALDH